MLHTLKLLLPALIPSWRFFDTIAPSPRIEFSLLNAAQDTSGGWKEFRPRPARLSIRTMLKRMFWNPRWNESLFLVSCAERLMENPTEHRIQAILNCIKADIARDSTDARATPYVQFRLVFISRNGSELQKGITFVSKIYPYADGAGS